MNLLNLATSCLDNIYQIKTKVLHHPVSLWPRPLTWRPATASSSLRRAALILTGASWRAVRGSRWASASTRSASLVSWLMLWSPSTGRPNFLQFGLFFWKKFTIGSLENLNAEIDPGGRRHESWRRGITWRRGPWLPSDVDLTWQGARRHRSRRRAPYYKPADALRYLWTQFIFSSPLSALSLQKPSTNLDSIFGPSKVWFIP